MEQLAAHVTALDSPAVLVALVIAGLVVVLAVVILGRRLDVKVGSIHAELRPNGGSSLRDALDRVEEKADRALSEIADLKQVVNPAPPT